MRRVTRRTWIGLGAAVMGQATLSHVSAQSTSVPRRQGGEPYLQDGGPSDSRVRVTRDLILLEGQINVFTQRFAAGDFSGAVKHLDDVTLDLRERIEPYMQGQGMQNFSTTIIGIVRALQQRDLRMVTAGQKVLAARVGEADRLFRKFMLPFHHFALRAAIEASKVALKSYASAIDDTGVLLLDEYQEGWGVLTVVDQRLERLRADLVRLDAESAKRMFGALADLKSAWPTPQPPRAPVMPAETVAGHVETLEIAAQPFLLTAF